MVCMRAKTLLMKEGRSFENHIKYDHDFWKYVKYLAYLKDKNKEDQSGFEDIVWTSYSSKLVNWIPSFEGEQEEQASDEKPSEPEKTEQTPSQTLSLKLMEEINEKLNLFLKQSKNQVPN
jgi:hypothetical protein